MELTPCFPLSYQERGLVNLHQPISFGGVSFQAANTVDISTRVNRDCYN